MIVVGARRNDRSCWYAAMSQSIWCLGVSDLVCVLPSICSNRMSVELAVGFGDVIKGGCQEIKVQFPPSRPGAIPRRRCSSVLEGHCCRRKKEAEIDERRLIVDLRKRDRGKKKAQVRTKQSKQTQRWMGRCRMMQTAAGEQNNPLGRRDTKNR